ncbi:MAG: hypothetical protein OEY14_07885, partial [Myxococcales bacterium]|nr:hypothetical protein [Myxococcales bacterium]
MSDSSEPKSVLPARPLTVRELLEQDEIRERVSLISGAGGLDRQITHPRIQKSGLILVGHLRGNVPTRIQVFGETEISFFAGLEPAVQIERARVLFDQQLSLVVLTRGAGVPEAMLEQSRRTA